MSFTLIFVAASLSLAPAQRSTSGQVSIVDAPRTHVASEFVPGLQRPFEPPGACAVREPRATIGEIAGRNAKAILVHHYDRPAWRNMAVVGDYVRRILDAHPEGGGLQSGVYWAEPGPRAEIVGSIDFGNGRLSRVEFANGYVHVEDAAGCQWWGRYLGGDRGAWVVRK